MSGKKLPKPIFVSWPISRFLLTTLFVSGFISSISWLSKTFWEPGRYVGFNSNPPSFPPLTGWDLLCGSVVLVVTLWNRWVWRRRLKNAYWHRWLASVVSAAYSSALILLYGIAFWNTLLDHLWKRVMSAALIALFLAVWMLPFICRSCSKAISNSQDNLSLLVLKLGAGGAAGLMVMAGILGASYGMHASRTDAIDTQNIILAFGFSILSIAFAQYNAEYLWPYRPWAKEDE